MKKSYLMLAAWALLVLPSFAQNIGINADASRPNANAILDIKSGNKGLLIPRMDSLARKRIPDTKGLLVYDISTDNFWYNTGRRWECIPNDKDRNKGGDAWLLKGNSNTTDGVNFLGTTNDVPLSIRVNNRPAGRIDSARGNTFWGYGAGLLVSKEGFPGNIGGLNTAIGHQAMYSNTSGNTNAATGYQAMYANTEGGGNTANGYWSLRNNTTGGSNTAIGYQSMLSNTIGNGNTVNGDNALSSNINGSNNTATGFFSMTSNISGNLNTAYGEASLFTNGTGIQNTSTGANSMYYNSAGNSNTANGYQSLAFNTTGSQNTGIGSNADVSTGNLSNATAIGAGAIVNASNKVRIGNGAVTVIEGQVPFTTPSDGRYKFNIHEDVKGLDFILNLRPVTYQFDVKRFDAQLSHPTNKAGGSVNYAMQTAYDEAARIRRSGFIAQEVEQAAKKSGYDFSGIILPKTEEDHYSLSYDAFVVPLVKSIQEQQQIILQQHKKLEEQDKKLAGLKQQLDEIKKLLQHVN
ncbi:MAG TPA: tail fiber domain-containing protein [Puia sp.]|jgi:hypothetical protein